MPDKLKTVKTATGLTTGQRVAVGLIAISLSLSTLALGTALFLSPGANFAFLPTDVSQSSIPSTATAATLTWTAPGDDAYIGQATSYDVRYSTAPLTAENFSTATVAPNPPLPSPAGSTESMTVTDLQPATTYFFALKTTDEAGNASALSNVTSKLTAAIPCVPVYTCTDWSACTNGTKSRTCQTTNDCPTGLDAPITTQICTATPPPTSTPPSPTPTPTTPPAQGGEPVRVDKHVIVAGLAPGGEPTVRVIDPTTKKTTKQFNAFAKSDRHGVHVAAGDLTGDHQADIVVGSGPGAAPLVKLFTTSGRQLASFNPYVTEKKSGVAVAAADVNGDGIDELITVPATTTAQVRVFTYNPAKSKFTQIAQFFAFDRTLRQGFTISAGDLNSDSRAEIVVAPRTKGRTIAILRLDDQRQLKLVRRFSAFPIQFTTGLTTAVGDVNGDGRSEIIASAGAGYYSHVKIFTATGRELMNFYPTPRSFLGGVSLTTLDVNRDGRDEVITGTYQKGEPSLYVFRYNGLKKKFERIQNYLVYPRTIKFGLRLGST